MNFSSLIYFFTDCRKRILKKELFALCKLFDVHFYAYENEDISVFIDLERFLRIFAVTNY